MGGATSTGSIRCVVVSQIFPPAVGGSGVLLDNVYSRLQGTDVVAVIDRRTSGGPEAAGRTIGVVHTNIDDRSSSLIDPRAWPNQFGLTRLLYRLAGCHRGVLHCGRAQPEGVPALLANLLPGGPPYVFWAHGEDISSALSSRQFAATMRIVYGRASAAIANSRNTARLIESTGWYRGLVHVIYPGVDTLRFHPAADDGRLRRQLAGTGDLLLLSVGRLQRRKGHDLVLKALPTLVRQFPGLRYVIVGDGDERAALNALARELAVQEHVHFAGQVPDADLPAYFAACDVFVMPTRVDQYNFEGFGIVYLEAAAAGRPAIGGRNGGVPEAVVDGETGLLVSGENEFELADAITRLASSADLRGRMGEAGRRRALTEFTWERAAETAGHIHRQVADQHQRSGPAPRGEP